MKKKRKIYDDDDGRTIADMSGVGNPSPIFGGYIEHKTEQTEQQDERPEMQPFDMTRKERGAYILGALGAALLIGMVFMVGLGLAILLMILVWSK